METLFGKTIFVIFWTSLFVGCSNLSQNVVTDDQIDITGGVYQDKQWPEAMSLHRKTWYKELTMVYDLLLYDLKKETKFRSWLSADEMNMVDGCETFWLAVSYVEPDKGGRYSILRSELEKNGFSINVMPNFSTWLTNHPDYSKWTLQGYKVDGLCKKNVKETAAIINLPGFKQIEFKI